MVRGGALLRVGGRRWRYTRASRPPAPFQPPSSSAFAPWRPREFFDFELLHASRKDGSRARVGRIHTPHGVVDTPGFVAVGTNAALKFLDHTQADAAGLQLMFCNTFHLLLHPGPQTIANAGGLHAFINRRNRPLITDSGGTTTTASQTLARTSPVPSLQYVL